MKLYKYTFAVKVDIQTSGSKTESFLETASRSSFCHFSLIFQPQRLLLETDSIFQDVNGLTSTNYVSWCKIYMLLLRVNSTLMKQISGTRRELFKDVLF